MTPQEIQSKFADNLLKAMIYMSSNSRVTIIKLAKALKLSIEESETILRHISI